MTAESSNSTLYLEFEQLCLQVKQTESEFLRSKGALFEASSKHIHSSLEGFHTNLSPIPLLSTVLIWAKRNVEDRVFGRRYVEAMRELISFKLLPVVNDRDLRTLGSYSTISHDLIINHIRSCSIWYLQKREDCVSLYITFANWLYEATLGFIKQAQDPDRLVTAKRKLAFERYIELLSRLPEREQLIAKLFYLGGARSLEDILALKISNVNFENNCINFVGRSIKYPQHVIEDIKMHLGSRKAGYLFSNTQSTDHIHHTVPYRALKKAAQTIGLPESFSYKHLVENI